jgi:hypothetical protein
MMGMLQSYRDNLNSFPESAGIFEFSLGLLRALLTSHKDRILLGNGVSKGLFRDMIPGRNQSKRLQHDEEMAQEGAESYHFCEMSEA